MYKIDVQKRDLKYDELLSGKVVHLHQPLFAVSGDLTGMPGTFPVGAFCSFPSILLEKERY